METTRPAAPVRFEADSGLALPDLDGLLPDRERAEISTTSSETIYVDTAERDLERLGLRLVRRVGDAVAGWALESSDGKTMISSAPEAAAVPESVAALLIGAGRGQELKPVLTVARTETHYRLRGAAGSTVLEVVDTRFEAATLGIESTIAGWREVEVAGDSDAGSAVVEQLRSAGATEAVRAHLDVLLSMGAVDEQLVEPDRLGGLLQAQVREQVQAITRADVGLRAGQPVIHPCRVAIRRLRSTLRVFGPVLDPGRAEALDAELRWIAGVLGHVRDAEILSQRLQAQLDELPAEDILGPVASHIRGTLAEERAGRLLAVAEALASDRYLALLHQLNAWRTAAPVAAAGEEPATTAAAYLKRARRKLRRRLSQAAHGHPEMLHAARKAAKRLRYSAELAEPALGHKAAQLGEAAKDLQTSLGEFQDASVSRDFLRHTGAAVGTTSGHNGYTYGLLAAHEQVRMDRIRKKLTKRRNLAV